ncbi:hypothetical protein POM88_018460 [Heracleum sosnowskyi]|uniref:Uncharacterized protein n=1 Tax=Heracleum sosnowskyi TaxID=360622 RepID=A0AAD8ITT1_9APIA|nr:hypothetical protein POM88_018460 [Heracleum sosnowskyi]
MINSGFKTGSVGQRMYLAKGLISSNLYRTVTKYFLQMLCTKSVIKPDKVVPSASMINAQHERYMKQPPKKRDRARIVSYQGCTSPWRLAKQRNNAARARHA